LNSQQLSNVGTDANSGVPNTEELVDETSSGDEGDTDEPSTESVCGNGGVIVVVDYSTHFGVGRVLPQRVTKSSAGTQHGMLTMTVKAASTLSSS
jgi:hypothetical protein